MRKILLIGSFLLSLATLCIGQEHAYSIRNYKAIDGLPQSQVSIMLEDNNGYLWIGTHGGGLARFDGREFKVYTTLDGLLNNVVTSLMLDSEQNLWIIHPRGISKFDGITFRKFVQPGSVVNTKRLRRSFQLGDSLFFISGAGTLGKIYKDSVYYWAKPLKEDVMVTFCHVMPDSKILLYLNDSSVHVKSAGGEYGFSHKKTFHKIYSIFNYRNDVWLTTDKGRFTIDFAQRTFRPAEMPLKNHIVCHDTLHDVFWTRQGNAFLKEKVTNGNVKVDTVLKDVDINQVLVDSEGNTWFATPGMGMYKYFIQDFDQLPPKKVKVVMAIHKDSEGSTWLGSMTMGLWKITKNGKVVSYPSENDAYRNEVFAIAESPDHTLWVGTSSGLGKYNRERDAFKWFTRDDGLTNASVMNLQFDEKGNLYVGTFNGGINYYDGKSFTPVTMEEGLTSNTVSASHYSRYYKKLFVGNEIGVSEVSQQSVSLLSIPEVENTNITSINSFRDSLLLIGSGGTGVVIYNPSTCLTKLMTTHHGMASDFIYFVVADAEGYVWIGTEKGINRVKMDNRLNIIENFHYDYENGLTGVETNQNAFYFSEDTKLFGLVDGIYQFNEMEREGRKAFDLHLTAVDLFYGEQPIRSYATTLAGFFKLPVDPVLPTDQNHITFHYNRVDKRYPKSVKFRYFLENFDKTWSLPSSNTNATYSNLPPGDYVFRVMSTNNQGSWSPSHLSYPFSIKAPFYHTASFLSTMFILAAGAVTLILYLRVKNKVNKIVMTERIRVKEQETLRKEIARDFHDEMGNQLTRIINYVSLLKLNGETNGNHTDLYTKVEDSAKYLYMGTRDFIWSIDPGNDELSKLFLHIRDFGEKLFEEKNINFRAFNEVKEKCKLPYGFGREANLIFKEAMTNAFKYSMANNVSLSLMKNDEVFEMSLEDDGIGFYTGEIEKSNGLKNIRERSERISAILRVESMKNRGTKIVLTFKLDKTLKYGLTV